MSYERILNFIIRKFKSYLPQGKRLEKIIDGKGEFIGGKGVSGPQKRAQFSKFEVNSRCTLAYLFLPSGSRESPTPASAEGAS